MNIEHTVDYFYSIIYDITKFDMSRFSAHALTSFLAFL